jgi:hypothetical protein
LQQSPSLCFLFTSFPPFKRKFRLATSRLRALIQALRRVLTIFLLSFCERAAYLLAQPSILRNSANCGDNGLFATNSPSNTETDIAWTSPASILPYGTQVTITGLTASQGTVAGTALSLSSIGDQIFAFTGSRTAPAFIAGIQFNVDTSPGAGTCGSISANCWDNLATGVTSTTASNRPPCLTDGTYSVWFSTELDNGVFSCSVGITATKATALSRIYTATNWTRQDATAYTLPNYCPLPVELFGFKAQNTEGGHLLTWQTASEKDNAYFDIESGNDGINFIKIGQVKGFGTSQTQRDYTFLNDKTTNGVSYYRLKQVDADGTFSYSKTVSVVSSKGEKTVVYPSNTEGVVFVNNDKATIQNIAVFNAVGQLVFQQKAIDPSNTIIKLNLSAFPTGLYVLFLKTTDGLVSEKVFKR